MKILQPLINYSHLSAFFYDGVIATGEKNGKQYLLVTNQTGEIIVTIGDLEVYYSDKEIVKLGVDNIINDYDIDRGNNTVILVDKFFIITEIDEEKEIFIDDYEFDSYEEAIKCFEMFLK